MMVADEKVILLTEIFERVGTVVSAGGITIDAWVVTEITLESREIFPAASLDVIAT